MAAVFSFDDEDHESFSATRNGRALSIASDDEHYVPSFAGSTRSESPRSTPKTTAVNTPQTQPRKSGLGIVDDVELDVDQIALNGHNDNSEDEYEVELTEEFASKDVSDISRMTMRHQADDFEPLKVLGKGGYGKVMLVRQKSTGKLYAQKQLKKASMIIRSKGVEYTKAERQILEDVRHPFIVKLFYAFQDHSRLYLILEYAEGGELWTHLETEKMFSEQVAAFYIGELVLALSHLHAQGIIYRDLKPENCLLDRDGHLIITDFGISKVADDEDSCANSFCGTAEYMCPEMLLEQPYSMAADWWSLGVLLFELCAGHPPFSGNNKKKIADKILKSKLTLPFYMSAEAKDLIGKFLKKVPKVRLGADGDITKIKTHRFFRKIDWKKLANRELEPPIKPIITDPVLAENFAPEFTSMPLNTPNSANGITIQADGQSLPPQDVMNFEKFTFVASPNFFKSAFAV